MCFFFIAKLNFYHKKQRNIQNLWDIEVNKFANFEGLDLLIVFKLEEE